MNELMHEAINKFHIVNIMCGTFVLEIEAGTFPENNKALLKKRLKDLVENIDKEFSRGKVLLSDINSMLKDVLHCYSENEHFLKTINSSVCLLETRFSCLKDDLTKNRYDIAANSIIISLHAIEEKALACGIVLNELKGALIKSGKYINK
jgi:hypothetical protein